MKTRMTVGEEVKTWTDERVEENVQAWEKVMKNEKDQKGRPVEASTMCKEVWMSCRWEKEDRVAAGTWTK